MVAVTELKTVFVYETKGVEDVKAKADAVAKSQTNVSKASDAAAASGERVERRVLTTAAALDKFAAANDRAAKMQTALDRGNREIQTGFDRAAAEAEAYNRSLTEMADAQVRSAQASAAAVKSASNDNIASLEREGSAYRTAGKFALDHPVLVLAGTVAAARGLAVLSTSASASLGTASTATARFAAGATEMGTATSAGALLAARGLGLASGAAAVAARGFAGYADTVGGLTTATGLLARGLSLLPGLLGPLVTGFAVFAIGSAALEKMNNDFAKMIDIGRQAEALDISAPFLKSFSGLGAKVELEVGQMQAALQKASGFVRDRYGQADVATRVFGDIDTGGAPLRAQQQLALAQTTETRIRAILAGMVELEERGQRLAAINIGEKVFGADLLERLRRGEGSIEKFASDLEEARGKELMKQSDVTAAVALSREIEGVKREIDQAVSATFDFSGAGLRLNQVWLEILKPVRDVVKAVDEATRGGDAAVMRTIQGLQSKRDFTENVAIPDAQSRGQADRAIYLREVIEGLNGEIDRLTRSSNLAGDKIAADLGQIPPPLRLMSDELSNLISANEQAARSLDGTAAAAGNAGAAMGGAATRARDFADALKSIQQANPNLAGTLSLMDRLNKVQADRVAGTRGVEADFSAGKLGDGEAQEKIRKLNDEAAASIKALRTEADKPFSGYVREAEIGQLDQLGQSLARASDRFGELRQRALDAYKVESESATSEAARADAEKRKVERLTQIDAAYKQVQSSARKAAAEAAARSAGGTGDDVYDTALKRSRDQVQEFELQARAADKAGEEVYKLTEANRLRRAAASAGRSEEAGVAEAIDEQAAAYARARKASEDAVEAQRRLQEGQREVAAEFGHFADDVILGGEKMDAAFKSLAKTFASGGLNALLTGSGPLAGILGTAPTERGQVGGLLGGQFSLSKLLDTTGLKDAVGEGAFTGITDAFGPLLKPKAGANGQPGGFMSTPLGQGLGVAAVGAGVGYASGSPIAGGLAGGLAGLMTGNPIMAGIGLLSGLVAPLFSDQKKEAKKRIQEQLKALREAYNEQKPEIEKLGRTFRGEATGGATGQINDAFAQMVKANKIASDGGDQATADKLVTDFQAYMARVRAVFARGFEGVMAGLGAGQGLDSAFAQAAAAAAQLGESLKAFVEDAGHLPEALANQARARAAAQEAALASLEAPKTLSATQAELARIQGAAAGLTQVLIDLGLSATDAATAIQDRTAKAMDALRASFASDLDKKLNDATGKGYLNEVSDLLKERTGLLADAAALGTDATKVEAYFTAAAQKIVNEAELTGDAFTDLTKAFPALSGHVHEFTEAVDTAAAKAAAAARALSYQDRTFAAGNDATTLYGQLVAYNRKAQQEIVEEQKAGGQAMADLLAAQNAERLKLEEDYYASVRDAQIQALEQARQAYDSFAKNIRQYLDGLRAGSGSPLSPQARLAAAQSQYAAQITLAQGGNRDALDGITGYASDLLDAAKSFYASSTAFQTIFGQVQQQLGALPTQVSPEQFIVNAITDAKTATVTATQAMQAALKQAIDAGSGSSVATALLPQFNTLTSATNGLLNYQQFLQATGGLATVSEQQAARGIFQSIDLDGDGQISKLELIRAQAVTGNQIGSDGNTALGAINFNGQLGAAKAETGNQILTGINSQAAGTKNSVDTGNSQLNAVNYNGQLGNVKIGDTNSILSAINGLAAVQRDQLIALNNQFSVNANLSINGQALNNNIVTALNKIVYNTAGTWSAVQKGAVPAAYSTGGWVNGPGTATSDSIPAMLSAGEYVVKADVARMHGSLLETLNGTGTLQLQAMNDNRLGGMMAPPMVVPMPVPMAASNAGNGDVVAAIERLTARIAVLEDRLVRAEIAGAEHIGEGLDDVKGAVNDAGRAQRLLAA